MTMSLTSLSSRVAVNIVIDLLLFSFIFFLMLFNQVVFGSYMSYLAMRITHKNRLKSGGWEDTEDTQAHLLIVLIICTLLNTNISLTHTDLCLNVVAMFGLYFLVVWNAYVYLYIMKKTDRTGSISLTSFSKQVKPILKYICVIAYDLLAPPMERDYWHYLACFVLFLPMESKPLIYVLGAIDLSGKRSVIHWVLYWIFTSSVVLIEYCFR